MVQPFTVYDLDLSRLHHKRFELYQRRTKALTKLNQIDVELADVELQLQQLHKDYANEQSQEGEEMES